MYEYGISKAIKVFLRRGREREKNRGDEPNQDCIHIWKCHKETLV
jgi:hypothetical protein